MMVWSLWALAAAPLAAQQISVGAGYALADYREQAAFLQFLGNGPTATLSAAYGRWGITVDATHLSFNPSGDATTLEPFALDQYRARLSLRTMSFVAVEGGFFRRSASPGRAAQSYDALTLGVKAAYPLAPGAEVALRTAYVAGSGFTGGGSAPFGIDLGLAVGYGLGNGRFRVTGDYEFQRIDRHTDQGGLRLDVPIQTSVARLGLAVRF
jgi:hypothetical protein